MTEATIAAPLKTGAYDPVFQTLYPGEHENGKARFLKLLDTFFRLYGPADDVHLFSVPGRSEICGNHTDHQHGSVLAAAVDLDMAAAVAPRKDKIIRVWSEGFPPCEISLEDLGPRPEEEGTSAALQRGVAARFADLGYAIGGFDAVMDSRIPSGAGLSSSAAYEVLIGTVLSHLYNEGSVSPAQLATIGQYAETTYFGKPCGLMDQMAVAVGGFLEIDFEDPKNPAVRKIARSLRDLGLSLFVTATGGSHADLTPDYAAIPKEMAEVAAVFGKDYLREVGEENFFSSLPALRDRVSDRAILRALHFFQENHRVAQAAAALEDGCAKDFLDAILSSGQSSATQLQNVLSPTCKNQGLALALALSGRFLAGRGGWRVHGGGFAGTIQAFVPEAIGDEYLAIMEGVFGPGSCHRLSVRPVGAVRVAPAPTP